MADNRKNKTSRPFRKRRYFTGKRKAGNSNESRSEPSREEDDRENVFIDQSARHGHAPKILIDPKERLTLPSHSVKPNLETLEKLNGVYEAMRRPQKRRKTESRIFNSLYNSSSSSSQQLLSPNINYDDQITMKTTLSRQGLKAFTNSPRLQSMVNPQSNDWHHDISDSRENAPPWQRNGVFDNLQDTNFRGSKGVPLYQPYNAPFLSSSVTDEHYERYSQTIGRNIISSPIRPPSIGLSEPSSSTAVHSSHQYWDADVDPAKNIWLSQANSIASAPPTFKNQSNIFVDQMNEQELYHQDYPGDDFPPSASSEGSNMQPKSQNSARRYGMSSIHSTFVPSQESHPPQQSDQVRSIPLSQNILVNFIKTPPQNKRLPVNDLDYFHVKSEPEE